MNMDGVNEIPEMDSKLDISETITPEICENIDDFEEAMDARTEQLNSEVESSPEANDYVNELADNYSVDDILSMKENSKNPNEMREIFQDACFGNHPDMNDEARAEMIENAKGNWEMCQVENHMYDMALDRLGYDSENERSDNLASPETSGDSGSETINASEGHEMDDISRGSLKEKQDTINEFLDRKEDSLETPALDQYLNGNIDSATDSVDETPTEPEASEDSAAEILSPGDAPDTQNEREPSWIDRQAYDMESSYTNEGFDNKYRDNLEPQSEQGAALEEPLSNSESLPLRSTLKETLSNLESQLETQESKKETASISQIEDNSVDEVKPNEMNAAVLSQIVNSRGR